MKATICGPHPYLQGAHPINPLEIQPQTARRRQTALDTRVNCTESNIGFSKRLRRDAAPRDMVAASALWIVQLAAIHRWMHLARRA
jgi:hypothetical protein